MAVPKYRTSKSEKGIRRSHHALVATLNSACPSCGEPRRSHEVCKSCGHYRGKVFITPKKTGMVEPNFEAGE